MVQRRSSPRSVRSDVLPPVGSPPAPRQPDQVRAVDLQTAATPVVGAKAERLSPRLPRKVDRRAPCSPGTVTTPTPGQAALTTIALVRVSTHRSQSRPRHELRVISECGRNVWRSGHASSGHVWPQEARSATICMGPPPTRADADRRPPVGPSGSSCSPGGDSQQAPSTNPSPRRLMQAPHPIHPGRRLRCSTPPAAIGWSAGSATRRTCHARSAMPIGMTRRSGSCCRRGGRSRCAIGRHPVGASASCWREVTTLRLRYTTMTSE